MSIRSLRLAMAADHVVAEQENAFICDNCLEEILGPRKCACCGKSSTTNDFERKHRT